MTDPIAFRPTEKAEQNLQDYMTRKNIAKKSDAVNEIIEGCSLPISPSSLTPQNPTDPAKTTTPLNKQALSRRAAEFILNLPLDVYNEIKELAINEYKTWEWNKTHPNIPMTSKLTFLSMEAPRSTQQ